MNNFVYLPKSFERFPKAGDFNPTVAVDLNFKNSRLFIMGQKLIKIAISSEGFDGVGVKGGSHRWPMRGLYVHILGKGVYSGNQ